MDPYVLKLVLRLFKQLDTPRSLACYIMASNGEWGQLVSLRSDPRSYEPYFHHPVERLRRDISATDILRKCAGLETGIDAAGVAYKGFYACEAQCCDTNLRLDRHLSSPVFPTELSMTADILFSKARRWIAQALGPVPNTLDGRFGPGATFESRAWRVPGGITAYDKLQLVPSVTHEAAFLEKHLVEETALRYAWGAGVLDRPIGRVRGNRFTTVPKDATKDRGICIEPGVNLLGQLAVGEAIRTALRRSGIDLVLGQDLHRRLAALASRTGSDATIDLSNASDTVAYSLVKLLLPDEWFQLLDSLRSHYTWIVNPGEKGRWVRLEKFSSMGNGFTFELETLLFCGLARACGGQVGLDTFVYGDDIIVPNEVATNLIPFLRYAGFTPNIEKTFTDGYFRESCGGDFFMGLPVRAKFMKVLPSSPESWISLANQLWDLGKTLPCVLPVRRYAIDALPSAIRRCVGPEDLGDLLIHDTVDKWSFRTRNSIRYFRTYRPVPSLKLLYAVQRVRTPSGAVQVFSKPLARYRLGVHRAAALMGLPSDGLQPRNVAGYRLGWVAWS